MNIIINGQEKKIDANITLQTLLKELSLEDKVMAAAVNMEIIKQNNWDTFIIKDNDKLELLDFVGGG